MLKLQLFNNILFASKLLSFMKANTKSLSDSNALAVKTQYQKIM